MDIINIRFVITKDKIKYLRQEDVINIIADIAATEETDVRNRLNQVCINILNCTKNG